MSVKTRFPQRPNCKTGYRLLERECPRLGGVGNTPWADKILPYPDFRRALLTEYWTDDRQEMAKQIASCLFRHLLREVPEGVEKIYLFSYMLRAEPEQTSFLVTYG
jgi:hypothetical protein